MTRPDPLDLSRLHEVPDPLDAELGRAEVPLREPTEPAPTRGAVRVRRWLALSAAAAGVGAVLGARGLRPDLDRVPLAFVLVELLLPALLAVAALAGAWHGGARGLGIERRLALGLAVGSLLLFVVGAVVGPALHPAPLLDGALRGYVACAALTTVFAALPLAAIALTVHHAFPVGATWRTGLLGTGAGLLAGAAINLHCANAQTLHVALGHGLPILAAALAGALLLARRARI